MTRDTEQTSGIHQIVNQAAKIPGVGAGKTFEYSSNNKKIVDFIKQAVEANPDEPVILVGHSFGGDQVVEISEDLKDAGIDVDLTIQIDSVGTFDDELPSNVREGLNYYQKKNSFGGEDNVKGAKDIEVKDVGHTEIDEKVVPRVVKEIEKRFKKLIAP